MSSSGKPFMTITLEDGTFGVVRTDPRKPQFLEVIAIFSDISRARSCAEKENGWSREQVIALAGETGEGLRCLLKTSGGRSDQASDLAQSGRGQAV
jgi:hypothetical protein